MTSLSQSDLKVIRNMFEICNSKGMFNLDEFIAIGHIYNKIKLMEDEQNLKNTTDTLNLG